VLTRRGVGEQGRGSVGQGRSRGLGRVAGDGCGQFGRGVDDGARSDGPARRLERDRRWSSGERRFDTTARERERARSEGESSSRERRDLSNFYRERGGEGEPGERERRSAINGGHNSALSEGSGGGREGNGRAVSGGWETSGSGSARPSARTGQAAVGGRRRGEGLGWALPVGEREGRVGGAAVALVGLGWAEFGLAE
jgi:hypothetical protein